MINEMARQFVREHFKSEQGVKCIMGWPWRGEANGTPKHVGYPKSWFKMRSIEDNDFVKFRTLHMFSYVFGDLEDSNKEGWYPQEHIKGVGSVIDVDSPNDGKRGRLDCLMNNGAINKMEKVRLVIREELIDWGLWDNCKMLFSGNGIYFILEDQYGSTDELNLYSSDFIEMCKDVNWKSGMNLVDIDSSYAWNKYFKVPFTFHWKHNRLSIPLNKDVVIDRQYLKDNCALDCNVSKVMRDSKW